jgi:selenocysteine lyase/cysteine desulfurase
MDKRAFLKGLGLAGLSLPLTGYTMDHFVTKLESIANKNTMTDESFWDKVRQDYLLKPDYINLENGYYNIMPQPTLEKFIKHVKQINLEGAYYMRTVQYDNKKAMAVRLAALTGCNADELIMTRNTTESLDMIIGGYPWQEGDEAVMAEQDYGAMLEMFKQVSKRNGVVNKIISVPNIPSSDEEIVNLYANAITSKTKLLMVCHMINITGQILPVKKICDMAHSKGVEVLVDGAHAIAHFRYSIPELGCDYYGASLHKWLSVPLGVGILYVKKEKISKIWPLLAEGERKPDDISRLNHTGTHPVHTEITVSDAIDYYLDLGPERKEDRLRYLQQYWTSKVRNLPNVVVNTPADPVRACGIANVGIAHMKPALLAETLLKKYRIYTVAIDYANVHGCRITPNVYTSLADLDVLVTALKELSISA